MKERLLKRLSKAQLRKVVAQLVTIDEQKLNKISRLKCLPYMKDLSYGQLLKLTK